MTSTQETRNYEQHLKVFQFDQKKEKEKRGPQYLKDDTTSSYKGKEKRKHTQLDIQAASIHIVTKILQTSYKIEEKKTNSIPRVKTMHTKFRISRILIVYW